MLRLFLGCLLFAVGVTAITLEFNGYDTQVNCSQGLSNCSVSDDLPMDAPFGVDEDVVDVREVQARAHLCCRSKQECKLCVAVHLQIYIHLQRDTPQDKHTEDHKSHEEEGGRGGGPKASVRVCTETILPVCKRVHFTLHPNTVPLSNTTQLSLVSQPLCVTYGSMLLISAHPSSSTQPFLEVSMPSLGQVCSLALHEAIEGCEVPRIQTVLDSESNGLTLQVEPSSRNLHPVVCLQYESNGTCQIINMTTIPLTAVATCMCLQAWWQGGDHMSRRAMSCPYSEHPEALIQRNEWRNISVSLALVERNKPFLLWNMSAPCRLDAQVWPCRRGEAFPHHGCKEITGWRRKLSHGNWRQNNKGLWEIYGAFEVFLLQFPPCVMVKVERMEHELGPFCINYVNRWRWPLLIFAMMPLFLLVIVTLFFQHNKIKTVRGHVATVLSPPDSEEGLSELVCCLGSFLQERGIGVSVDQWSRSELGSTGPLPWLYSQLLRLEQGGGKVVLVLTRGAMLRAQEWASLGGLAQGRDVRGLAAHSKKTLCSPYADLFSASLSCLARDRQLGRAGERFLLVDFEACPAQLSCSDRPLPELLQGLSLFRLPSQNKALLSELLKGVKTANHTGATRYFQVKENTLTSLDQTLFQSVNI